MKKHDQDNEESGDGSSRHEQTDKHLHSKINQPHDFQVNHTSLVPALGSGSPEKAMEGAHHGTINESAPCHTKRHPERMTRDNSSTSAPQGQTPPAKRLKLFRPFSIDEEPIHHGVFSIENFVSQSDTVRGPKADQGDVIGNDVVGAGPYNAATSQRPKPGKVAKNKKLDMLSKDLLFQPLRARLKDRRRQAGSRNRGMEKEPPQVSAHRPPRVPSTDLHPSHKTVDPVPVPPELDPGRLPVLPWATPALVHPVGTCSPFGASSTPPASLDSAAGVWDPALSVSGSLPQMTCLSALAQSPVDRRPFPFPPPLPPPGQWPPLPPPLPHFDLSFSISPPYLRLLPHLPPPPPSLFGLCVPPLPLPPLHSLRFQTVPCDAPPPPPSSVIAPLYPAPPI